MHRAGFQRTLPVIEQLPDYLRTVPENFKDWAAAAALCGLSPVGRLDEVILHNRWLLTLKVEVKEDGHLEYE